jgi:RND family efflux transporter MFP subunit
MERRKLVLSAVGLVLAVGVGFLLLESRPPKLNVAHAQVTNGDIAREVLTSGTLEPAEAVDVGTQVSGTIQSLHADFNATVAAGQLIAQLDPSVFDSELAQARAALIETEGEAQRAQVMADDAKVKAERARELGGRDLITGVEIETAVLAAKQTAAELVAARAAARAASAMVDEARVNRERTTIRSPIDGIVISRAVEVGQTLAASVSSPTLFRIAALGRMHLMADVSEAEVGGIRPGSPVTFEIESLGERPFEGVVSEVRLQPTFLAAGGASGGSSGGSASRPQPVGTSGSSSSSSSSSATPSTGTSTSAGTAAAGAASTTTAVPAGSVVSYTAVIDVDNRDHAIAPGSTAIVFLPTARRAAVTRIPNAATSFRPAADVLEATGQKGLQVPELEQDQSRPGGRRALVWKLESGKFVPIEVSVGISDERWTELLSGPVKAGDALVTSAATR